MRAAISFLLLIILFGNTNAQTSNFDSVLAKKLHADEYGMKKYILVLLKTGTAIINDKKQVDSIFKGHLKNIQRLAAENKLVLAGPMGKNDKSYEGLFILNTESIAEASALLATDPAIHAKLLDAEVYLWYGSAAVQQIPSMHEKVQRTHF